MVQGVVPKIPGSSVLVLDHALSGNYPTLTGDTHIVEVMHRPDVNRLFSGREIFETAFGTRRVCRLAGSEV
jgi:hypothetical protein